MVFHNLEPKIKFYNPYFEIVIDIIRKGIAKEKATLKRKDKEELKNQQLAETFNIIGAQNEKETIYCGNEHTRRGSTKKEDIYFYINDDNRTRVFYLEGKRLPKAGGGKNSQLEEYVKGVSTTGKPSGGIERYKLGVHGEADKHRSNGLIAYIENKTISDWKDIINQSIATHYRLDTTLEEILGRVDEFSSAHKRVSDDKYFIMHHFWIDLTKNK